QQPCVTAQRSHRWICTVSCSRHHRCIFTFRSLFCEDKCYPYTYFVHQVKRYHNYEHRDQVCVKCGNDGTSQQGIFPVLRQKRIGYQSNPGKDKCNYRELEYKAKDQYQSKTEIYISREVEPALKPLQFIREGKIDNYRPDNYQEKHGTKAKGKCPGRNKRYYHSPLSRSKTRRDKNPYLLEYYRKDQNKTGYQRNFTLDEKRLKRGAVVKTAIFRRIFHLFFKLVVVIK